MVVPYCFLFFIVPEYWTNEFPVAHAILYNVFIVASICLAQQFELRERCDVEIEIVSKNLDVHLGSGTQFNVLYFQVSFPYASNIWKIHIQIMDEEASAFLEPSLYNSENDKTKNKDAQMSYHLEVNLSFMSILMIVGHIIAAV